MKRYIETTKKIWKIYTPFHKYVYLQLGIIILVQIVSVSSTVINSKFLTNLVDKNVQAVIYLICIWIVVRVAEQSLDYFARMNREKNLADTVTQYLQGYSYTRILNLTVEQHIEDHSAVKIKLITDGERAVNSIIDDLFLLILPALTFLIISLTTLAYHSPLLGFVSFIILIILFWWSYSFTNFHLPYREQTRKNWVFLSRLRHEAFSHLSLVKYFGKEDAFVQNLIKTRALKIKDYFTMIFLSVKHGYKKNTFIELSEMFSLGIATYLFLTGRIEVGTIYLILSLNSRMYWQISDLQRSVRTLPLEFLDVEKYLEIIEKEPSFSESGNTIIPTGDIKFSHLQFKYPYGDSYIFKDFSVTIPEGKVTAFVGTSGSGKSTIIKLLMRAYDYTSGSITLDGVELKSLDAKALRHTIGYVEQHVELFDDTIKENILFGVAGNARLDAEKNLESIAKKSRISEFYHRLGDKKFDTFVGERGVKLSGGERQRVGIARAIIKNPSILIFDEATSALDTENEKYIHEAIEEVSKGKTTIIIAHRLSTVRNADKIIVMERGAVVAEGSHEELMTSSSHYQTLVAHQLSE